MRARNALRREGGGITPNWEVKLALLKQVAEEAEKNKNRKYSNGRRVVRVVGGRRKETNLKT